MEIKVIATNADDKVLVKDDLNYLLDLLASELDRDENIIKYDIEDGEITEDDADRIYEHAEPLLNAQIEVTEGRDRPNVKQFIAQVGKEYRDRYDLAKENNDKSTMDKAYGAMMALKKVVDILPD